MILPKLVAGAVLLAAPSLAASVSAPHVTVSLVADVASLEPGRAASVGLRFEPEHGWHVYWRNPGDSGEAPRVTWRLPSGFAAGELVWPAPVRIPVGPLANYGYEGTALLPATLTVPRDLAVPSTVALHADAHWLVCNEDECIPGAAPLVLDLPAEASPPQPSREAPLFATARARVPVALPEGWRASATADGDTLTLRVRGDAGDAESAFFFPFGREMIEHAAPQTVTRTADGFALSLRRAPSATAPSGLDGVLVVGGRAYTLAAPLATPAAGLALEPLLLAFAGGLLLNLMPCVFPVLAIKAIALLGVAAEGRRTARVHGLAYTAGVLASFWALAAVIIAIRAGGAPLGWGFQLQSPIVVAGLAALFFWMALTLLDVTTVGGSFMGVGNRLASAGGARGAFVTGVLATVVATPCSAPFMGTALGYALVQPPAVALAVFTALALGLACPYLVLSFAPAIGRLLPRPGRWMDVTKQLLAFPLLATVVWLVWVGSVQSGPTAVAAMLGMLVLLGLAAWIGRQESGTGSGTWVRVAAGATALAAAVVAAVLAASIERAPAQVVHAGWEPYSTARLGELLAARRPVFVDFTAAWCVTCQVNERLVLARPIVRDKMRALGVVPVRADWTTPDPDVTRALQKFGRDGVPLYVLYSGREDEPPRILPQLLTTDIVITELEELQRRNPT
jgi:thiol:disulfide interchange protein DsbD